MLGSKVTQKDLKFARNLKRLRNRAGITQEMLASKTRLSTVYIGLLETGKRQPSLETLQRISNVLGVKTKELVPY
jgi:transcriptional regulator with XRE-family HTH domain